MSEPFLSSSMHPATGRRVPRRSRAAHPRVDTPEAAHTEPPCDREPVEACLPRFRCVDFASAAKAKEDETRNGNSSLRQPIVRKSIARA